MRFLFCSLASPGFLHPSVGVAKALSERGHTTAFATDESHAGFLAKHGLERIARGPEKDGPSFQVHHWFQPLAVAIQFKHIVHALGTFKPDVLVGQQLTLGPLLMAERARLPVGLLGLSVYLWPASDPRPEEVELNETEARLVWRHGDMMKWYNQARALLRLPNVEASCRESPLLGDLFMIRSLPELEGDISHLPERVHLVGPCLWEEEEEDAELDAWLAQASARDQPVVYVQHGRFFDLPDFWPHIVTAFGDSNFRVAASVGRMDGEVGELPENFLTRPYVPQGRVLRQAAAVVASANSTVALGSLVAGVPSLLVPAGGEQPEVADRWQRAGISKILAPAQVSAESLRREVEALRGNATVKSRVRRMASVFGKADGFATAADLLETLAETREPVPRKEQLVDAEQTL